MVDELSERIKFIEGNYIATINVFIDETRLQEQIKEYPYASQMLKNLDHESIIRQLWKELDTAEQLGDAGTADFLTTVMEKHEKMAWRIRSFVELQNN